ncbi:hypothetical protein [Brachybacterium sp. GPGPB12]|uniref:hypothetical protein n=1 Tax=Brachybacterium sp. GPGPB12 TaxID=3023517 RepID=UPI00313427D5
MSEVSLLLRAPSANRVYAQAAGALSRAEAHWVLGAHLGAVPSLRDREVGGMAGLEVRGATGGSRSEAPLAMLSGTLGVLDVRQEDPQDPDRPLPRPRPLPAVPRHPSDLETTLRYTGKTNEQFTALLVNLAAALSARRAGILDGTLDLLDPLCGRGTTLNRAARLGLSPVGAEIDRKDVETYRAFLGTWSRTHRFKHTLETTRLTVHGERLGDRTEAELAPDKQTLRAGGGRRLTLLGCDTTRLGEVRPAAPSTRWSGTCPTASSTAPARAAPGGAPRSRSRARRRPAGARCARDGAGVALAVNRRTLDHAEASAVLAGAGSRVLSADGAFRHRVDQSIDRDILLAVPFDHPRAEELAALGADQEDPIP